MEENKNKTKQRQKKKCHKSLLNEVRVSKATCPGLNTRRQEIHGHHGNHILETHWYWFATLWMRYWGWR